MFSFNGRSPATIAISARCSHTKRLSQGNNRPERCVSGCQHRKTTSNCLVYDVISEVKYWEPLCRGRQPEPARWPSSPETRSSPDSPCCAQSIGCAFDCRRIHCAPTYLLTANMPDQTLSAFSSLMPRAYLSLFSLQKEIYEGFFTAPGLRRPRSVIRRSATLDDL